MEVTQEIIDALIVQVKDAETAGAISNEMVGTILDWINTIQKDVAEVPNDLSKETTARQLADTGIRTSVTLLEQRVKEVESLSDGNNKAISTLLGKNANSTIESFNEIIKFLEGVSDTEKLVSKLNAINERIGNAERRITTAEGDISGATDNIGNLQQDLSTVDDHAQNALEKAGIAEKNAENALKFAESAARTAAATSEAVNTVNSHTGIINNIRDKIETLEGAKHFEEVASEEELQARLAAGTLKEDILYFVAES